jgi:predicted unusual protein kinase regulating ubiquinone biosynthesis (AarF/ABC1/UbiB family)
MLFGRLTLTSHAKPGLRSRDLRTYFTPVNCHMKTFRRLVQIVAAFFRYGVFPEFKLTRRRAVPRPVRLRLAFEELGATWVKLGQALALRFDLLPPSYCYELFQLFNDVAPFPYSDVESIIRGEFGREVAEVYSWFDPEPIAAASIGQVHRATLPSGERVAVKVQRPGIEDRVETDLRLMHRLAFLPDLLGLFGGTPTRDVIDEFTRWLSDELDYANEAMNAYTLRENARFDPIEYNPKVWLEYSRDRVITLEYIDGIPVSDILKDLRRDRDECVARLRQQGLDLDRIAGNIVWNFLNQVYAIGLFHADLHPANLIVLPANRIGYVDFGITGSLPAATRASLGLFAARLLRGDADGAMVELTRWVTPSARTSHRDAVDELKSLALSFLFELRATQQSRQALAATYQIALLGAIRRHRMRVAPEVLTYVKALITMDSITSELAPTLDLVQHELRFFSALTLDEVREQLRPRELVSTITNYRNRIDRTLDFVDTIIAEQRAVFGVFGSAKVWLERLAFVAIIGLGAIWFAERYSGHTHGVFNTNAGFLLFAVGGIFLAAVLRQTRKLPHAGTRGSKRRRLKRRATSRTRNGWPSPPPTLTQSNGRTNQESARPKSGRTN